MTIKIKESITKVKSKAGRKKKETTTKLVKEIIPIIKERKRKANYINKEEMFNEVVKSKAAGKLSNELSNMIMMLCRRYGQHPWFVNYTYNDDMQSFALLTVVKMWHNFNPEKYNNAFAYFTQIIKCAFYQYKTQEKKHRNIRDKLLIENGENPSFTYMSDSSRDSDGDSDNYHFERMDTFENDEIFNKFDKELDSMINEANQNEEVTVEKIIIKSDEIK